MRDEEKEENSSRRSVLSGFVKAAAAVTVASVALDAAQPLLEQATGAQADTKQAVTLWQEASAKVKSLSSLAGQEQETASRLAAEAQQAADAAADAVRIAEAARLSPVATEEQIEEAKANAERLSAAAEAAKAKGKATVVERIRAEDSVMAAQRELFDAVQRFRVTQVLATGTAAYASWWALTRGPDALTAIAEKRGGAMPWTKSDAPRAEPATPTAPESPELETPEVGGQRSAVEIFKGGLANLADEPFGWFFGAPSPLYSSSPSSSQEEKAKPVGVVVPTAGLTSGKDVNSGEATRDSAPSSAPTALASGKGDDGEATRDSAPAANPFGKDFDGDATRDSAPAAMSSGKGFGGGEATRDPEPTAIDLNDPKAKQQAIPKVESFADYLARRNAGEPAVDDDGEATRDSAPTATVGSGERK
jgi:hypothetical protein